MLRNTTPRQVFVLVVLAVFLRIFNFSFPAFTTDEARIAFRGYELSQSGVDELGRRLPFIFNSLNDYQLPVVSYLSALGAGIFGKSELGARLPFILMGIVLILLTYKVAAQLSKDKAFFFLSAFLVATSPVLIFVSKVPNESIVATTLLLLLFYLLNRDRLNVIAIFLTMILFCLTSKFAWFIVFPFVVYTVFVFRNTLNMREKLKLSVFSLFLTILVFVLFFHIPQGGRSLSENNLLIFSDIAIKNGIDRIRGQGIQSGWPPILERFLVSKAQIFSIGILHWLSNIQLSVLFGQFSKDRSLGFISMGAFPKLAVIPALLGLFFLSKGRQIKLLAFPLIVALPSLLIYPQFSPQVIILTLPFFAFVIAFGLLKITRVFFGLFIILMFMELMINYFYLSSQNNIVKEIRPDWIKPIMQNASNLQNIDQVFISDNLSEDPASFIEWFTSIKPQIPPVNLDYPYKFRQTNFGKIKFLGLSDSFRACKLGEKTRFFVTKRDLDRMRRFSGNNIVRTFLDSRGVAVIYVMEEEVCIN